MIETSNQVLRKLVIFTKFYLLVLCISLTACQTDRRLKRVDPEISTKLYEILEDVDKMLNEASITYWLAYGSLLGAIRHGGIIPWDDDVDLAFFEEDIVALKQLGAKLESKGYFLCDLKYYFKICPKNGKHPSDKDGNAYSWTSPHIDLFPMKRDGAFIYPIDHELKTIHSVRRWFEASDIDSGLIIVPFGNLFLPIPRNSEFYLKGGFGSDVFTSAHRDYDHMNERHVKSRKVRLVTFDPAPDLRANCRSHTKKNKK